jgi:hypothetical protein
MSKDHWDAILASSPLNATAGKVTSKGESFTPAKQFAELSWDVPPPLAPITDTLLALPHFEDITGLQVGRFKVIGLAAEGNRWVCRCACGRYVGRRAGPLKAGRTTMCDVCNYTDKLRWQGGSAMAKKMAESPEARKWLTPEEQAAKDRAA